MRPTSGQQRDGVRRHQTRLFDVSVREPKADVIPLLILNGVGARESTLTELRRHIDRPTVAFEVQPRHLGIRPSLRTFAKNLSEMLDELDVAAVDVLGLSWGGMAAQQFAHDHSPRVRRLVLASTTPGFLSVPAKPASTAALLRPKMSSGRAAQLNKHLYAGDFLQDPSLIHKLGLLWPSDRRTYHLQMVSILGWSSLPWLPMVRQQTLILHGDDDPVVPIVNARIMQRLLPNAAMSPVPRGGHLYLYTRPQQLGRLITDFLTA